MSDITKRFFDLVASVVLLVATAPLMLVLALLVYMSLGSPVIFAQTRPGRDGRPFVLYKFRTMRNDFDASGKPLPNEQRLTRMGRFLRASSLDELPELWNVLKGDMSLVGPRPLLMEYLPLYSTEQARRHEVRPGITGPAQVAGRNLLSWDERFRLDVWYVDNHSILLDLKILVLTVWKVITREGISVPGKATIDRFTGNDE